MGDVLIRGVPDDVLAALDQRATRLGLSRTEYIRRRLAQDARTATVSVTVDDWCRFADAHSDLANPAVMGRAWE
jgi:Ribbon-helix-helix protein, copG family